MCFCLGPYLRVALRVAGMRGVAHALLLLLLVGAVSCGFPPRLPRQTHRNSEQGGPGAVGAEYKNVSQGLQTGIEIETETSPIAASAVADKSGLLGLDRG